MPWAGLPQVLSLLPAPRRWQRKTFSHIGTFLLTNPFCQLLNACSFCTRLSSRGPPQTPTRTPSHLSTVVQSQDSPGNPLNLRAAPARPRQILQPLASTNVAQQTAADANASSRPPDTRRTRDTPPSPGNARPSRAPPPDLTDTPALPSQALQPSASASFVQGTAANANTGSRPSNP